MEAIIGDVHDLLIGFGDNPGLHVMNLHFQQLVDLDIGSAGFKSVVERIDSHSSHYPIDVKDSIGNAIGRLLEEHIKKWLSEGDDQVYNVLDMVFHLKSDGDCPFLLRYNHEWFVSRRDVFLPHAIQGYQHALRVGNNGVVEKMESMFPELVVERHKRSVETIMAK